MCGCLSADAVTTDRDTVPGSNLDLVLCEVCNTPSLVTCSLCRARRHVTSRDRKTTRSTLMDHPSVVSLKRHGGFALAA